MSILNTILTRMMSEPEFTDAVFGDADKALAEYNLSTDEIAKFRNLSRADFEAFASASPEERKSFALTGKGVSNNINILWGDY